MDKGKQLEAQIQKKLNLEQLELLEQCKDQARSLIREHGIIGYFALALVSHESQVEFDPRSKNDL
jgi:hypothetical protein